MADRIISLMNVEVLKRITISVKIPGTSWDNMIGKSAHIALIQNEEVVR